MGRDHGQFAFGGEPACFNPRARMGRDILSCNPSACVFGFNPRARMGRDAAGAHGRAESGVSIHAPVWGATRRASEPARYTPVSIHAPVWGATVMHEFLPSGFGFQSTRPYGARLPTVYTSSVATVFQSTRPYGARR